MPLKIADAPFLKVWRLAWPVMLSTALTQLLSIVDMAFVARMGTESVAAVTASSTVTRLLTGIGAGIGTAVLALTSRFFGAEKKDQIAKIAFHGTALTIAVGAIFCGLLMIFTPGVLRVFSQDDSVLALGIPYLRYMLAGLIFLFVYFILAAVLHGCGDTKTPLRIITVANVVNLILDPLLIFGLAGFPRMGITGAGLASLIAQILSCGLAISYLIFSRKSPAVYGKGARMSPDRSLVRNIFSLSLPASAQMIARPLSGMLLLYLVSFFGTAALAAFGIGLKLTMFCSVFMSGLTAAVGTLVGQSLGRESLADAKKVIRASQRIGNLVFLAVGLSYFFLAKPLMQIFVPEPEVLRLGVEYIRILSVSLTALGMMASFSGTFQGSGDTPAMMQTAIIANWPIKLGCAWFMGFIWPGHLYGIWIAISLSIFIETALQYIWYKKGGWHKKQTIVWKGA